jgi:hypothetical protein
MRDDAASREMHFAFSFRNDPVRTLSTNNGDDDDDEKEDDCCCVITSASTGNMRLSCPFVDCTPTLTDGSEINAALASVPVTIKLSLSAEFLMLSYFTALDTIC